MAMLLHPTNLSVFVLVWVAVAAEGPPYSPSCPPYGCALLPRDIAFDDSARRAFQKVRRYSSTADRKQSEEYDAAIKELESCCNGQRLTLTLIGYKGGTIQDQINQDRAVVLSPFRLGIESVEKIGNAQLVGVFDGHGEGGERVSEYAVKEIPRQLATRLDQADEITDDFVVRALNETFVVVDQTIPTPGEGGSTASVILRLGKKLYMANAGDSVSLVAVVVRDQAHVVYVSREDKPDLPDERRRIEAMGGQVYIPEVHEDDTPRVVSVNAETGKSMALAMSRSLGDRDMAGVIAEPVVDTLDIPELVQSSIGQFNAQCQTKDASCAAPVSVEDISIVAISATDGLVDYITPSEIAAALGPGFSQHNERLSPITLAEDLVLKAAKEWNEEFDGTYRDDIALALSLIPLEADDI